VLLSLEYPCSSRPLKNRRLLATEAERDRYVQSILVLKLRTAASDQAVRPSGCPPLSTSSLPLSLQLYVRLNLSLLSVNVKFEVQTNSCDVDSPTFDTHVSLLESQPYTFRLVLVLFVSSSNCLIDFRLKFEFA
jgi:hypothetical protein